MCTSENTNAIKKIKTEIQANGFRYNIENTYNKTDDVNNLNTKWYNNTFHNFENKRNDALSCEHIPALVEERVKLAKDDIKNSFNLLGNIEQYIELDLSTIPEFIRKGYKDYFGVTQCTELIVKIDDYRHCLPTGSVKPLILINKNGNELIFAYKESNGKNVLKKAVRHDSSWIESVETKLGNPILEIHNDPVS
jgi:hypothetical protein